MVRLFLHGMQVLSLFIGQLQGDLCFATLAASSSSSASSAAFATLVSKELQARNFSAAMRVHLEGAHHQTRSAKESDFTTLPQNSPLHPGRRPVLRVKLKPFWGDDSSVVLGLGERQGIALKGARAVEG